MKLPVIKLIFVFAMIFILGWMSSNLYSHLSQISIEKPSIVDGKLVFNPIKSIEKASPSDHVKEHQIHVYSDRVYIDQEDIVWSTFTDTNSMDPLLDVGANGLEIVPKSPKEVNVGDVISYRSKYASGIIIHRVIEKGRDGKGIFFIAKGDNNAEKDPEKIRFDQIEGVLVGVIY